jgi:hypothetical protein
MEEEKEETIKFVLTNDENKIIELPKHIAIYFGVIKNALENDDSDDLEININYDINLNDMENMIDFITIYDNLGHTWIKLEEPVRTNCLINEKYELDDGINRDANLDEEQIKRNWEIYRNIDHRQVAENKKMAIEYSVFFAKIVGQYVEGELDGLDENDQIEAMRIIEKRDENISLGKLCRLINGANYMYCQPLLHIASAKIATLLKNKTKEEMDRMLNS